MIAVTLVNRQTIVQSVDVKKEITPLSFDKVTGQITFAYPDESFNAHIPDNAGNTLQLVLTVQ